MRNIKFRVWDKKRQAMCYCERLEFVSVCLSRLNQKPYNVYGQLRTNYEDTSTPYCTSNQMFVDLNQDNFIIQQFTGLQDIDGNDIYEGDIVEYTQLLFNTDKTRIKQKEIKWIENLAMFNVYETEAGQSNHKVIGNIFENKQ